MSRDLEHQSLESTFSKVAELEFDDDEDDIRDSAFPNGEDAYDDESDSSDSSSEGSVDLGLADDLRESDSAMQCVLEMEDVVNDLLGVKLCYGYEINDNSYYAAMDRYDPDGIMFQYPPSPFPESEDEE